MGGSEWTNLEKANEELREAVGSEMWSPSHEDMEGLSKAEQQLRRERARQKRQVPEPAMPIFEPGVVPPEEEARAIPMFLPPVEPTPIEVDSEQALVAGQVAEPVVSPLAQIVEMDALPPVDASDGVVAVRTNVGG